MIQVLENPPSIIAHSYLFVASNLFPMKLRLLSRLYFCFSFPSFVQSTEDFEKIKRSEIETDSVILGAQKRNFTFFENVATKKK